VRRNPLGRSATILLLLAVCGLGACSRGDESSSSSSSSSGDAAFDRAVAYYPRFRAWNDRQDLGWIVFELMTKLNDVKEVASPSEEEYETRLRDDPEFASLVQTLIQSYENNCVVTGHVSDGVTGEDVGAVVLSFDTGSRTVRTSSSNLGDYRLLYPRDGEEAVVSTARRGYYPSHRRVRLDGHVVGGRDLVVFPSLRSYPVTAKLPESVSIERVETLGDYVHQYVVYRAGRAGGFLQPVVGPPRGKVVVRLLSRTTEYEVTATLNPSVPVSMETKPRSPSASSPNPVPLVRSAAEPHMETRPAGTGPGSPPVLTLDGTAFPPRLGSDPVRIAVAWTVSGTEPDSGVVVVEGRCPGTSPQLWCLPRGKTGSGTVDFWFQPSGTSPADTVEVIVSARTHISWPGGDEKDVEARISQTYHREHP